MLENRSRQVSAQRKITLVLLNAFMDFSACRRSVQPAEEMKKNPPVINLTRGLL